MNLPLDLPLNRWALSHHLDRVQRVGVKLRLSIDGLVSERRT